MNRIWSVRNGAVSKGAPVYQSADTFTIEVGETGRNRERGYVVLAGIPRMDPPPWYDNKAVGTVTTAALRDYDLDPDEVVIVFETTPGFRGSCWQSLDPEGRQLIDDELILARGYVAQGDAGRMGGGTQLIIRARAGMTFFEHRTGRLYGAEPVHVVTVTSSGVEAMPLSQWQLARPAPPTVNPGQITG